MRRARGRLRGMGLRGGGRRAGWLAALVVALLLPATAAAAHERLPAPAFRAPLGAVEHQAGFPRLVLGSSAPNAIIDVRAWFRRNGIVPSEWALQAGGDMPAPALPARFDRTFRGTDLVRAIDERPRGLALLIYGGDGSGRYVVGANRRTGEVEWSYDLGAWRSRPARPQTAAASRRAPCGRPCAPACSTSRPHTTRSPPSPRPHGVRPRDRPRDVEGALVEPRAGRQRRHFVITSGVIVTGYGFTDEPDRLLLLDVKTGLAVDDLAVRRRPSTSR